MATKKDLVEAYSFSRRRLVTAFVSGAPGGREVEPTRPGRTIIGGVALAVLLLAGAAVSSILGAPKDVNWDEAGLFSEKESGADYVLLPEEADGDDSVLRPIANITSAMLLLGPDVEPTVVPREEITGKKRAERIGILDAPETPPTPDSLVQTGWTACTGLDDGRRTGIHLTLGDEAPDVTPTPDAGVAVRSRSGDLYLVAESVVPSARNTPRAHVYRIPDERSANNLLSVVDATSASALPVPDDWVTLFPEGAPLELATFGISRGRLGDRPDAAAGLPGKARIGTVLVDDDDRYLVTADGAYALDPFAAHVYASITSRIGAAPGELPVDSGPSLPDTVPLDGSRWPEREPRAVTTSQVCAQLDAAPEVQPDARLAVADTTSEAAAVGVPADEAVADVEAGHGAFVQAADWDDEGSSSPVLVDDRGFAYSLEGDLERTNLGYGSTPDVLVPEQWLDLFEDGVTLSVEWARCPTSTRRTSC